VVFIGDGPVRELLERKVRARGAANVHFHPQVALAEMPRLLAAADALLVTLSAHPTFEDFVPSKLIDFMASGRPVILAAAGESARIVTEAGGGIAVAPEDPQALADAIHELRRDPAAAERRAVNARTAVRPLLRSEQAARLERVIFAAVADGSPDGAVGE